MLQGPRGGDDDTKDVNVPSSSDHAGAVMAALSLSRRVTPQGRVLPRRTRLHNWTVKTAREEQGMSKHSQTTELPDFAAEATVGKDGAKTANASECQNLGVNDDDERVACKERSGIYVCTLWKGRCCVLERPLLHLTEPSTAGRGFGLVVKNTRVARSGWERALPSRSGTTRRALLVHARVRDEVFVIYEKGWSRTRHLTCMQAVESGLAARRRSEIGESQRHRVTAPWTHTGQVKRT